MDFLTKAHGNEYDSKKEYGKTTRSRAAYEKDDARLRRQFESDATEYILSKGVPAKYAPKIFAYAWQEGHSSGYSEIAGIVSSLVDIFNVN